MMFNYYEIVKRKRHTKFVDFPDGIVPHPERTPDLSKGLLNAKGQKALYRHWIFGIKLSLEACILSSFCLPCSYSTPCFAR
jgi:hypothetical protein